MRSSRNNCKKSLTCTGVTRNIATDVTRRPCVLIRKASSKDAFLIKEPELKGLLKWSAANKSAQFWELEVPGSNHKELPHTK